MGFFSLSKRFVALLKNIGRRISFWHSCTNFAAFFSKWGLKLWLLHHDDAHGVLLKSEYKVLEHLKHLSGLIQESTSERNKTAKDCKSMQSPSVSPTILAQDIPSDHLEPCAASRHSTPQSLW
jgi:hypothetical protein